MKFIVYDIEATCWEGTPPGVVQETIEIGAYRLDRVGNIEAYFDRLIKPEIHPQLSHYCRRLTSIDQADINRARRFDEVIDEFVDWTGWYDGEDIVLGSWGNFDPKQLRKDCRLNDFSDEFLERSINLREQYRLIKKLPKKRGLKSAVKHEGFDWLGDQHRALDDAKNTVQLFRKFLDDWEF